MQCVHTLGNYVFNILATKLGDHLLQFLSINLNTNRGEDLLHVSLAGVLFVTQKGEKVSGDVTHSEIVKAVRLCTYKLRLKVTIKN